VVGKYSRPSYEKILELKPQAVLAYEKSYSDEDFAATLEPLGIKVVKLNLFKPETYDDELRSLAKALGKEGKAGEFIAWKKQKTDLLAERLKGLEPQDAVSVLAIYTSNFAEGNYKTFARDTSTHQGIEAAGGRNIAGDMEGYPQVNGEWILEQNPEAFVLNTSGDVEMGYDATDLSWSENVVAQAGRDKIITKTDAGKNGRVYLLYNRLLSGDKTYLGAFYLAKWFYPDLFEDIEPDLILREYFEKWIGVPFAGIWSYKK
jgi:iron complex transport system substrate-binding protein